MILTSKIWVNLGLVKARGVHYLYITYMSIIVGCIYISIKPRSHLAEYFPIVYDRDNWAIANNLKPIGTVIVSVEKKSVSFI